MCPCCPTAAISDVHMGQTFVPQPFGSARVVSHPGQHELQHDGLSYVRQQQLQLQPDDGAVGHHHLMADPGAGGVPDHAAAGTPTSVSDCFRSSGADAMLCGQTVLGASGDAGDCVIFSRELPMSAAEMQSVGNTFHYGAATLCGGAPKDAFPLLHPDVETFNPFSMVHLKSEVV